MLVFISHPKYSMYIVYTVYVYSVYYLIDQHVIDMQLELYVGWMMSFLNCSFIQCPNTAPNLVGS